MAINAWHKDHKGDRPDSPHYPSTAHEDAPLVRPYSGRIPRKPMLDEDIRSTTQQNNPSY